jgi:hypothetical protein
VNAEVAPKVRNPGGRALIRRAKAVRQSANWLTRTARSGGVCSDGTETRMRWKLEKPSSPRREIVGAKVGRITGNPGKSAEGERVADGLVVAMKRGNARGAKRPCCRAIPLTTRKAGAR